MTSRKNKTSFIEAFGYCLGLIGGVISIVDFLSNNRSYWLVLLFPITILVIILLIEKNYDDVVEKIIERLFQTRILRLIFLYIVIFSITLNFIFSPYIIDEVISSNKTLFLRGLVVFKDYPRGGVEVKVIRKFSFLSHPVKTDPDGEFRIKTKPNKNGMIELELIDTNGTVIRISEYVNKIKTSEDSCIISKIEMNN